MQPLRVEVLLNVDAGAVQEVAELESAVRAAFVAAGASPTVFAADAPELARHLGRCCRRHEPPEVFVVAGGDGTVNAVLAAALDHQAVLSVLPLGTFNHFAKDLDIPDDLGEAAAAIVAGVDRCVDVGEVNGELFINNSAIGVYPEMVAVRDHLREHRGWGKVRAVPVAIVDVLRHLRVHRIELGGGELRRRRLRTPMVFVGNGRYHTRPGGSAGRVALDDGVLHITVAAVTSRRELLRVALSALLRGAERIDAVDQLEVAECTISARARRLRVARDGEIGWASTPLHYRCRPAALRIRAPRTARG